MSAPIDRKGRDVRAGKREDRMRRDRIQWDRDRVTTSLEAGASPADIDLER